MEQNPKTLERILRELLDKVQANYDTDWDWNGTSGSLTAENGPVQDRKLIPSGPMHKNCVTEICVSLDGHTHLELTDRKICLEAGQFFVIPAGILYRECAAKGEICKNLWLNIRRNNSVRANVTGSDETGRVSLRHTQVVEIGQSTREMLRNMLEEELFEDRFGAVMLVKGRLIELMIDMIRHLNLETQDQFAHKWQKSLVEETMDFLYSHGAERTELQDVAEHLNISERQLNRVFKTATGTTVINYFNNQRILRARYYLISTNLGLKEIAEKLSYYDQYHFSRMFKKMTGYTPGQFRKIRREG